MRVHIRLGSTGNVFRVRGVTRAHALPSVAKSSLRQLDMPHIRMMLCLHLEQLRLRMDTVQPSCCSVVVCEQVFRSHVRNASLHLWINKSSKLAPRTFNSDSSGITTNAIVLVNFPIFLPELACTYLTVWKKVKLQRRRQPGLTSSQLDLVTFDEINVTSPHFRSHRVKILQYRPHRLHRIMTQTA